MVLSDSSDRPVGSIRAKGQIMSRESREWLNQNTLIGYTADRDKYAGNGWMVKGQDGNQGWWHLPGYTGGFEGPIPIDAVLNRLFYWEPVVGELTVRIPVDEVELADGINDDGTYYCNKIVPGRKAIIRPDTEDVLGIFMGDPGDSSKGYQPHFHERWLIENVATLLDQSRGELGIATAGQLKLGAQAYVSIELPETIVTAAGFPLRSNIIAMTSFDGSLATTYKAGAEAPLCDNSLFVFVAGVLYRVKIKHSSKSLGRIGEVRDALGIIYENSQAMVTFLDQCAETVVTDNQFQQIVDQLAPVPERQIEAGKVKNQRAITVAEGKQGELMTL